MNGMAGDKRIEFKFLGDISLGGAVRELMTRHGTAYPFERVRAMFAGADVVVGNLECCLLPGPQLAAAPRPRMTGLADHVTALAEAGVDVVSLANNHAMDAGTPGLRTALESLPRAGITCFGAAADRRAALQPTIVTLRGRRIGFVGACEHSKAWAGRNHPGVAPLNRARVGDAVRRLRAEVDLVVAVLHADFEFTPCPAPARIRLSRWLVDQGADVVVQHHPHVWQGIEHYGGGLIAYSVGNFVFPVHGNPYLDTHPGTTTSGVLSVTVDFTPTGDRAIDWQYMPVEIKRDHRPHPLTGEAASAASREIDRLCALLADPGAIRRHRYQTCRRELRRAIADTYYAVRRGRWRTAVSPVLDLLRRPDERTSISGFLTGGRL